MTLLSRVATPAGTPYGLPVPLHGERGEGGTDPASLVERALWAVRRECCLWSAGMPGQVAWRGLRVVPCVQPVGAAGLVRPLVDTPGIADGSLSEQEAEDTLLVYAQSRPGDHRAANAYGGGRLVLNVETSSWRGNLTDTSAAEALAVASSAVAVTSHGFILARAERAMTALAARGLIGMPQVYDGDASAAPRRFVRTCVAMYKDVGFREVVPILEIGGGSPASKPKSVRHLRAWADACEELGCNFHVWRYGQAVEAAPPVKAWLATLAGYRGAAVVVEPDPVADPASREYVGPLSVSRETDGAVF